MNSLERQLTVCICTRDRPESLARALDSVRRNAPEARIVVADDGRDAASTPAADFPRCRWVQGPRRGLGANRNAVVAAAETPWVLFLDDDAELGDRFVGEVESCLDRVDRGRREHTIVTGRELNRGTLVPPHDVDFLGFQRCDYAPGEELHTVVINAAVWPRSLFFRVRFDERLRYGSDEVDLSYGALAAGYRIEYCPTAVNVHLPAPAGRAGYAADAQVSRLRATTKRYWRLRKRRLRAAAFVVLAPGHLLLGAVKREGLAGLRPALVLIGRWLRG